MTNRKREKVRFQQRKGRPVLTRDDAEYWLDFLPKVLKIGTLHGILRDIQMSPRDFRELWRS